MLRPIGTCAGEDMILRGSGDRWSLTCDAETVASFVSTYRAKAIRCDVGDATWWFELPRGTRLVARMDGRLEAAASYEPKMRGGVVQLDCGTSFRLKPPRLFGDRWALRPIMQVRVTGAALEVRLAHEARAVPQLALVATLALAAVILERGASLPPAG